MIVDMPNSNNKPNAEFGSKKWVDEFMASSPAYKKWQDIQAMNDVKADEHTVAEVEQKPAVEVKNDPVSHPTHYTYGNIEVIDMIDSCGFGLQFCLGNAMKYIARCLHKNNTLQDLEKAMWYINHAVKQIKNKKYEV